MPAISAKEQHLLNESKVLVAGCGGLGGHVLENLLRLGIGTINVIDGDAFQITNLNRQLLSSESYIGISKVLAAKERAASVNPSIRFSGRDVFLDESNADALISGMDIVIDALDNISSRLVLEDACARAGIPFIHGAICGWQAQICTVIPGSNILHQLYENLPESTDKSALAFSPALCASIQTAEAVKILCGHHGSLENKLAVIDLRHMDWNVISFDPDVSA